MAAHRLMHLLPKSSFARACIFIGLLFFALLVRIFLMPNPGFEADISFWKSWGLAVYDRGLVWSMHNTNNNYPTPFAYLLGAMVKVYSLLADPHNFYEFWSNNNVLFLAISKAPAVLADFGIVAIFLWLGKSAKRIGFPQLPMNFYAILALLYILNPISIMDGAWWGQVDSVGVFLFLLAVCAALTKRPLLAGIIYMTAMMTKLQNMIYGPVFFVFLWQSMGYKGLMKGIVGAVVAFFGLNIEFFLSRDMERVLLSLTENYDYFPLLSLNAYNLWWIVAGGAGMKITDKIMTIGMTNAKTMGLLLFASSYLFAVLFMVSETLTEIMRKGVKRIDAYANESSLAFNKTTMFRFFGSLATVAGAFFLFQTQSHDRYAFPLSVFLLLWAPFLVYFEIPQSLGTYLKSKSFRFFLLFYGVFSIVFFYNLHTALVDNYPQNAIPILRDIKSPNVTIPVSFFMIGLFIFYVSFLKRYVRLWVYLVPLAFFLLGFAKANSNLITKKPVTLSSLTPIVSQQGYGTRQANMPANASFDFTKWSPLSVQYYFYRRGIGTHASSLLIYDINKQFKRFTTDIGIDTQAGGGASAVFEIYGDGKKLYTSEKIGRYDTPKHLDVDITGVKMLGLVTTDGGDGINDDHTDWLNTFIWP